VFCFDGSYRGRTIHVIALDNGQNPLLFCFKMSSNNGNHPANDAVNNVLRERSPNLPDTVQRGRTTSTPSTLSSHTERHVQFDQEAMGRTDRSSLLALAYMPPSDDEDDGPAGQRTPFEDEQEHDLNQLIDYKGDSDDKGPDAEAIECDVDNTQHDTEGERAVEARHDAYTACEDALTPEELAQQQGQQDAPPLISGAPPGWSPPVAPKDWKPPKIASSLGQPDVSFSEIDNPGGWSEYTFAPKFQCNKMKREKYLHHVMPAGATLVPRNNRGKRTSEGFEFFYNGWTRESTDPVFRSGATRDNLFPRSRKSTLDADLLVKLGMNKDRMYHTNDGGPDSLFFYQLILPIHDTQNNGTADGDPRKPFYPHVSKMTEIYSIFDLKLRGSGHGHHWKETSPMELIKWDGIIFYDGVLGGSHGAMLRRWDRGRADNSSFNKAIHNTMSST